MGWLGKIIGGTIGLMLGGPIGMIAGATFGHMIDKSSEGQVVESDNAFTQQDRTQMVFFVGAFSMLAKLATADGPISEKAQKKVHEFMIRDLQLSGQSYNVAIRIFNEALGSHNSFEEFARQFYQNFSQAPDILQMMTDIFYRVALADGRMSLKEESLIDYAGSLFRIPRSVMESLRRQYGGEGVVSGRNYSVLGLRENATVEEIKKAYRKLSIDFHPDTVIAKGMSEEFVEFATKRFREIQEAYEAICKERGIK